MKTKEIYKSKLVDEYVEIQQEINVLKSMLADIKYELLSQTKKTRMQGTEYTLDVYSSKGSLRISIPLARRYLTPEMINQITRRSTPFLSWTLKPNKETK